MNRERDSAHTCDEQRPTDPAHELEDEKRHGSMERNVEGYITARRQPVRGVVQCVGDEHQGTIEGLCAALAPVGRREQMRKTGERTNAYVVANDADVVEDELVAESVRVDEHGRQCDGECSEHP